MRRINRTLKIIGRLKLHGKKSFFFTYNHIFLLIVSTMFLSTAMGINSVSLPYVLFVNKVPDSLIGLSTASDVVAGVFIIYFLHKLSRKIGLFESIAIFGVIGAITILILPFYQNYFLWFLLTITLGMSLISIMNLRRSWMNMIVRSKIRSMAAAVWSTAICIGFTIGPIIVKFLGAGNYQVFVISSIFILISFLVLLPIRKTEPEMSHTPKLKLIAFIKRNPKIMLARFITDFQCGTIVFFTVIYGIKSNISAENSGLLISIFSAIGILDFLLGFIINYRTYYRLIFWGFAVFLVTMVAMPIAISNYYSAIVIYLILGWVTSLIAICCWYGANLRRRKNQMVFINSAFMAVGLLGTFLGSLLTGIAMQLFGKEGFVIVIAAASLIYLWYIRKDIPSYLKIKSQN